MRGNSLKMCVSGQRQVRFVPLACSRRSRHVGLSADQIGSNIDASRRDEVQLCGGGLRLLHVGDASAGPTADLTCHLHHKRVVFSSVLLFSSTSEVTET